MVASREIAQSQAFCCDNSFILKARLHAGYRSIHAVSRFQAKTLYSPYSMVVSGQSCINRNPSAPYTF